MKDMPLDQARLIAIQLLSPYLSAATFYDTGSNPPKLRPDTVLNKIPIQHLFDTLVQNDKDNSTHFFEDFIRQLIFLCHNAGYTIALNTDDFINGDLSTFGKLVKYILDSTQPSEAI